MVVTLAAICKLTHPTSNQPPINTTYTAGLPHELTWPSMKILKSKPTTNSVWCSQR